MSSTVIAMAGAQAPAATIQPVRVLLAEREWLVRAGIRAILAADDRLEVVGVAADHDAAVRYAARTRPDVVVLDATLGETQRILEVVPAARVLLVTPGDADEDVLRALRTGAAGAVARSADPSRLVEGIRTVASGGVAVPPHIAQKLLERAVAGPDDHRPDPVLRRRFDQLSERELDVVRLLARGCSNAEIAGELYLSEGTVKTYVTRTLNKLRLRSRVQVVVAAYDAGLVKPRERSVTSLP